jgi:Tol biopolymer transport system component
MPNSSSLSWIDGGKRLLFSEIKSGLHMGVVVTDPNRGNSRDVYLPAGLRSMAHHSYLSPDGRWVLVVQMNNQGLIIPCRVVPFQGTAEPKVVGPPGGTCLAGAWSPDGQWLYVTAMPSSSRLWRENLGDFHIWRQHWPDGKPEQLTFGPTSQLGLAMAPDGKSLITSVGSRDESVWLHDKDGDHQVSTEGNTSAPSFSPDGHSLYFLRNNGVGDDHELWVRDMASGQINGVLPDVPMQDYDVSPDGKNVAYVSRDASGQPSLWIAPTSRRHSPVRLSTTSAEDSPHFLPDGDLIFRSSEGGSNYIYRMKADGSDRHKLIPQRILELWDVSPDGRWLTAAVSNSDEELTASLTAFAVDGGAAVPICYGYCMAGWDLSGKYLYFIDERALGEGTHVIPMKNDVEFPEGVTRADDIRKTKNQIVLPAWVQSGNGSSVYAYVRDTTRSNLYRVPLQ